MALESIPTLRIVTGKGGVGKTVTATALAVAYAQAGYKTLLAEINGGDRVAALLDAEPMGSQIRQVMDRLCIVDINPHDAMHEYALLTLRFEAVYKLVFENRLTQRFLRLVPSLNELVMLGKIWFHRQETTGPHQPRFDCIIVDAPATGHAMALLQAAQDVYGSVPPGPMRDNAVLIRDMLHDQAHTMLDIVTTAEEMPVTEAIELLNACGSTLGMKLGNIFVNQWVPPLPTGMIDTLAAVPGDASMAGAIRSLQIRAHKQQYGVQQLNRLPPRATAHVVQIPRVVTPELDREGIMALAAHLTALIAVAPTTTASQRNTP